MTLLVIMKQVNLLVFASLCCLVSSAHQVYYITPTKPDPQGSCHVNDTTLSPCYTLQQLNGVLSSSSGSVEVLLLPGTHLIAEKETLNVFNFSEVMICPWKEELEMIIECIPRKDHYPPNIWFQNIIELKMLSLHFSSCQLKYGYKMNSKTERSVSITKSVFEKSSVDIRTTESNLNVIVSNCTFSSTNRFSALSMATRRPDHVNRLIANLQITDTFFQDNTNNYYNLEVEYTNLMIDNCCFINNSGDAGGVIHAFSSFLTIKRTTFLHYHSSYIGSVPILSDCSGTIDACLFLNNSNDVDTGHSVVHIRDSEVSINNSIFEENNVTALYYINTGMRTNTKFEMTISNCTFRNNSGIKGGALQVENSVLDILNSSFSFNKAVLGGAIYSVDSNIQIYTIHKHNTTISNNIAYKNGGAFYLDNSRIHINSKPLILSNNVAKEKGGAIFVHDINCENTECLFKNGYGGVYIFMNNTAPQGPVLYGGLLDRCHVHELRKLGIDDFKSNSKYKHTPEAITSDPVRICLCTENHELNCTTRNLTVSDISTGQTINLLGTVVDQDNNPKASYIRAGYTETTAELGKGEGRRETGTNCSKLSYHIFTRNHSATLVLQPEGVCASSDFSSITVYIEVKSCPHGFEQNDDQCECDKRLSNRFKDIVCDINADTITTKESTTWLRYDENYLKVQANCPLDYCKATSDNISLDNPDEQCANNRSGVTCGS